MLRGDHWPAVAKNRYESNAYNLRRRHADVLSEDCVVEALTTIEVAWKSRI